MKKLLFIILIISMISAADVIYSYCQKYINYKSDINFLTALSGKEILAVDTYDIFATSSLKLARLIQNYTTEIARLNKLIQISAAPRSYFGIFAVLILIMFA